jgi:hypothetical protein
MAESGQDSFLLPPGRDAAFPPSQHHDVLLLAQLEAAQIEVIPPRVTPYFLLHATEPKIAGAGYGIIAKGQRTKLVTMSSL